MGARRSGAGRRGPRQGRRWGGRRGEAPRILVSSPRADRASALLLLRRRHLASVLIEEPVARLVESLGHLPADLARNRTEAAPRRLRLTNVFGHRSPLRFFAGAAADGVGGQRLAEHLGERL